MSYHLILLTSFNALAFLNLVVQKGWEASLGMVASLTFSAFIVWLNPMRKMEVKLADFEKLREETASLKEQFTQLRIKIGFQRSA